MALEGLNNIPKRYFSSAERFWWAYVVAEQFHLSPREVKEWPAEDVMEALAYIRMVSARGGGAG